MKFFWVFLVLCFGAITQSRTNGAVLFGTNKPSQLEADKTVSFETNPERSKEKPTCSKYGELFFKDGFWYNCKKLISDKETSTLNRARSEGCCCPKNHCEVCNVCNDLNPDRVLSMNNKKTLTSNLNQQCNTDKLGKQLDSLANDRSYLRSEMEQLINNLFINISKLSNTYKLKEKLDVFINEKFDLKRDIEMLINQLFINMSKKFDTSFLEKMDLLQNHLSRQFDSENQEKKSYALMEEISILKHYHYMELIGISVLLIYCFLIPFAEKIIKRKQENQKSSSTDFDDNENQELSSVDFDESMDTVDNENQKLSSADFDESMDTVDNRVKRRSERKK